MSKTVARFAAALVIAASLASVELVRSANVDAAQRSVPSSAERQGIMRNHYFQVGEIHDALIRGELKAIQEPARRLAILSPATPVPAQLTSFVTAMKASATKLAEAKTIEAAAAGATDLLSQCAGCHRAAGIRPVTPSRNTPDVGGKVGHMLEHQRATDALLLGLLLPSASEWELGAGLLDSGELRPNELPRDSKLVAQAKAADTKVHALSRDAISASTPERRNAVYASVVTACADCHKLHPNIWGPRSSAQ